ncbi:hypothetical protein BH18ACT12_BH18ACT12_24380 [soil metagenome]
MTAPWIAAFVALWAVVLLLGLLVVGTLRRLVPIIERTQRSLASAGQSATLSGLPPGTTVPAFAIREISGDLFAESDLRGSRTTVLFLGSSCNACEGFVRDLSDGRVPHLQARLVVVADEAEEARGLATAPGVTLLVQEDRSLARVFESDRVPHAFVIDEEGRVLASGWPNDWEGLQSLVESAEKGGGRENDVTAAAIAS